MASGIEKLCWEQQAFSCVAENNIPISQPKHMLWVLEEPSQSDGSFEYPKHMLKIWWVMNYLQFYTKIFCLSKPMVWEHLR